MPFPRQAGILLHPTSLPGRYGIGEIGPEAHRWLAHLNSMSQKLWQVLPMGPTGYADSPYQTLSTFAGNTMLISFDSLREDYLLREEELQDFPALPEEHVEYGPVILARSKILHKVAQSFGRRASPVLKAAWMQFCEDESKWLEDYTLFVAIKKEHGGGPWIHWPEPLRRR
jgi:4-alpha-glucanotransferase